jgi:hypothetical protein
MTSNDDNGADSIAATKTATSVTITTHVIADATPNTNTGFATVIEFTARDCKSPATNHKDCIGVWQGMGLRAICDCQCHNRSEKGG